MRVPGEPTESHRHVALDHHARGARRGPRPPSPPHRIAAIGDDGRHRYSNHRSGRVVGERLDFILDTIETELLPWDPKEAFRLLVAVIEQDGAAMEIGMDYEFEITTAMERAAALMVKAAPKLPASEVRDTLTRLVAADGYGTRAHLQALLESLGPSP